MTTIVIDGQRKVIVTDSQVSDDDSDTKSLNKNKCFRIPHGWLAGAGDYASIMEVVDWYQSGKKGTKPTIEDGNDSDFVMLNDEGAFVSGKDLRWLPVHTFDAIGSGAPIALGVMSIFNHLAEDAVLAATKTDLYSGGDIKTYSLKSDKPTIWKSKKV